MYEIEIKDKYALNVSEAAAYFGIGEHSLRRLINSNPNAEFLLKIGNKVLLKRRLLEKYLDDMITI